MEDRTLDSILDNLTLDHITKPSSILETEQVQGDTSLMEEHNVSCETQESSPEQEQEQKLRIFRIIDDLSNKMLNLKKEHAILSGEVKDITTDASSNSQVFNALGILSSEHEHLKKKYLEECSERKRLYNEVIELKGNIRVFCRCRPLSKDEIENGSSAVVDFDASQENELQIICSDSSKKQFKFDHVFMPIDSQEAVFAQTSPVVVSVLDGYNVCIFAYGQTGTGKTFTMEGTPENRGVNYRTLEELFHISKERSHIMRYELYVSILEVYNEKIRDLLVENSNQPAKKLEIKQAAEGTQEVPGLVEAPVYSTNEVWELLKSGSRVRSVGSTNANELSSRSHCLLRVTVKGENVVNGLRTRSHLWLVDLAGSERVGKIEVEGERLKESQFINKSLSALGDVISALASKTAHVPYRNSKLTHLLQSSLGGDCKTLMFVQISPSATDLAETLCSLNFATRVRGIESGHARKQADLSEFFKYKQMAEKLKHEEKEAKKLQDNLQSLQFRLAAREQAYRSSQEKVRDLENQLADERKTRLKQESRAIAAASYKSSALNQTQRTAVTEKKPPLAPSSKMRLPLRGITNFMPPPSPAAASFRTGASKSFMPSIDNKENISKSVMASTKAKTLMKPRRTSMAVRPPPPSTTTAAQVLQPRRRASIATLRPELNSHMATPLNNSSNRLKNSRVMGRQSFCWDPQRVWRVSRVNSPLLEPKTAAAAATVEMTPMGMSSKFMGSPPMQAGSSRPRHPTIVALQRKPVVWSPLKLRNMKNYRKSFLPS